MLKAHSHYCVFHVHLQQMVAFLQVDRKFPISALMQPTAENADQCIYCELAFTLKLIIILRKNVDHIIIIITHSSVGLVGLRSSGLVSGPV